jgi:diguanylate cyclase (GGDEF)-like protein
LDNIRTVDPALIVDAVLILSVVALAGFLRSQRVKLDELRAKQRAHEVESGNKLATLEQVTGFDALTGLRGQRWFENALAVALRGPDPVSVIYIDLDGIKSLNLAKGHQFVDGVIRHAAMAIRTSLRRISDRDMICRRGDAADEFLVILDGVSLKIAVALAEQILTSLRLLPTAVTASIGVATRDADRRMSAADLERAAEIAMDLAKADGKNCVRPVLPEEKPTEAAQQWRRRNLKTRLTHHRLLRQAPKVAGAAAESIPDAIPVEVTERTEVTERAAA